MRLAIDARMMGAGKTRGIGRYIEELVRAMTALAPEHRYVLLMNDPESSPFVGHPSVEHAVADVPWYGLEEQFKMPKLLADIRPDLVHVPHWNVAVRSSLPRVVTIHDVILLDEPQSAKVTTRNPIVAGVKRLGYRIALQNALFTSRRILVPTEWVASEIRRHVPKLTTPIDVTGEGMPHTSTWMDPDPVHPYLLYVGSAYPHKNLDVLLDAWKRASEVHPKLSLIIAGERDVFMQRLEARVEAEHIHRVRFTGRVSEEELEALYTRALAFVFPSKNEGFGLPPLEALAHGCPVIAARASCVPEVLGNEGILFFEPGSPDGILAAIETALRDPVGVRDHARLSVPGLHRRHSWRSAAERTLGAYEAALRKSS
jgi:glycosyltransferase involved in cell wall biosynthesis